MTNNKLMTINKGNSGWADTVIDANQNLLGKFNNIRYALRKRSLMLRDRCSH